MITDDDYSELVERFAEDLLALLIDRGISTVNADIIATEVHERVIEIIEGELD
jgi:hypothetical protein